MCEAITHRRFIVIVEPMIQSGGNALLPCGKRKEPAVFFELVHNELIYREFSWTHKGVPACSWVNCQNALQTKSASGGRKHDWWPCWKVGYARHHRISRIVGQRGDDRKLRCCWSEDTALCQQRN